MDEVLTIDGAVKAPARLTMADLAALDARHQVADVSTLDPKRAGSAVRLQGLLERVGATSDVLWLTLHAALDDFHASIPLESVRERGVLIYALQGAPLPRKAGGPFRFFIPDFAACHTHEIDECANVKFVDRIELSAERGVDNRPHDGAQHEALHRREASSS